MSTAPEQIVASWTWCKKVARLFVPAMLVVALTVMASAPAGARTPRIKKPGPPTNVAATAIGGGATVSWTAPLSDGGSPITGYTATASHGGQTCTATVTTTCTVSGLTNGHLYRIRVRASNTIGTGRPAIVSVTPALPTVDLVNGFPYSGGPEDVTLSGPSSSTVQADFTTSDGPDWALGWGEWIGDAAAFSPSSGVVTFAPGQIVAAITFAVDPANATGCSLYYAPDQCYPTATVTLSNPTNALLGANPSTNLSYVG